MADIFDMLPWINDQENPKTQFHPEDPEEGARNTQAYRFARNSGASERVALQAGEQELQTKIATHMQPHQVQDLGPDYSMGARRPAGGGGAGGGGQPEMTLNGGAEPGNGLGFNPGVQQLQNRINPDGQFEKSLKARQALAALNALQKNQDNRGMQQTERLLSNPGALFGRGGGDWASAWSRQMAPRDNLFGGLARNQANMAMGGYGNQLNQTYNSPAGPYGQMQAAAAATAPARASQNIAAMQTAADRDIARMRFDTTKDLFGRLLGRMGGGGVGQPVSSIETDYGASARLRPASAKKYMPGGPTR